MAKKAKKVKSRVSRRKLPQPKRANPFTALGEVSKPFIIGIITLVAIVALAMLLLFSKQFVGKAFYAGEANTAGIQMISSLPQEVSFKVSANIGSSKTNTLEFKLSLPQELNCNSVKSVISSLTNSVIEQNKCENNQIIYTYTSLLEIYDGQFDIMNISLKPQSAGNYTFKFDSFDIVDDQNNLVFLNVLNATIEVVQQQLPTTCFNPPSGLVNWWPGENNATDIIGNFNGDLKNGTTFTTGKVGQAFSFDGKDDEVRVLTNPVLGFSSITVSAWVNPNKLGNQQYIINAPGIHLLANTGGNVSYGIRAGSGQASIFITSNTSLLQNAWNYVVGTYDSATGLYKVYINGNLTKVLDGKDNLSIEPLPTEVQSGLTIGNALPFAASLYFNGSIDEVAIWNKALTIEEIQAIYNAAGGLCKPTLGTCGDNQREFGEVCDGSEVGSATCSNVKGTGWSGSVTCTDNCQTFNTSQCVVASICGNGIVEPASEECDDDNNVNGDGCDLNCKKEVCGNGVIQSWIGETCDDGNIISEDNCSNACQIEQIQQPTDSCIGTTPANATLCQGDDTNLTANTTRTLVSACTLAGKCKYICNEGYTFNETINTCMLTQQQQQQAVCGDEVIDTDEQCDGTNLSGKVCTDFGWVESNQSGKYIGGTLSCANCKLNLSGCTKGQPETQNKKISLTDADTTDAFVTNITATETFSTEVTVYTVLYGANDKVLSIKSEKIEDGLTKDKTYTAIVNYAKTSVKKKSVLVYNTKQSPTVFGKFEKTY